jgi:hypothetical protein
MRIAFDPILAAAIAQTAALIIALPGMGGAPSCALLLAHEPP